MHHREEGRVYKSAVVDEEENPELVFFFSLFVDSRHDETHKTWRICDHKKHDDRDHGDYRVTLRLSFLTAHFLDVLSGIQTVVHVVTGRFLVVPNCN